MLAEALKRARPPAVDHNTDEWATQAAADRQWQRDILEICLVLHDDNPAFDEAYFQSTVSGLTKGTNATRGT